MKRPLTALALASAALVGCQSDTVGPRAAAPRADASPSASAAARAARDDVIHGQYVVLFRRGRVAAGAAASEQLAAQKVRKLTGGRGALRRSFGHAVQGFAAALSDSVAAALRADPDVALVEPDHVVHATGAAAGVTASGVEANAPWNLDRIDQQSTPLDGQYHYAGDGAGTSVYVIDTGINQTHADFGGRAVAGIDFVTPGGTATDCQGHGTHVAGTVGGATYGVAKGVRLVAVRVLDCSGNGSGSDVIAALDWVAQQKKATPAAPAVANLSLSGGVAAALDSAVARTTAAGVTVVVAAGNSGVDACTASPARAPEALTVAATDASDNFANFSNYGACVDLAAPGVGVLSDYVGSTTATAVLNGTSMASPHVAGAAALYLAANPAATPAQVATALVSHAAGGPLQGLPPNTPSRLLYTAFIGATPSAGPLTSGVPTPNVCADIKGGTATAPAAGAPLQAWQCHGGANQRFLLQTSGAVEAYDGQLCLDVYGAKANDGDPVVAWTCRGSTNQKWSVTAAGELRTAVNGKCLDLWGAKGENGAKLVVWSCHGGSNQKWSVVSAAVAANTVVGRVAGAQARGAKQSGATRLAAAQFGAN